MSMDNLDFYVHGFWLLGALIMAAGVFLLGNAEWVEGTTEVSFGLALLLGLIMVIIASMLWISASVNARQELRA